MCATTTALLARSCALALVFVAAHAASASSERHYAIAAPRAWARAARPQPLPRSPASRAPPFAALLAAQRMAHSRAIATTKLLRVARAARVRALSARLRLRARSSRASARRVSRQLTAGALSLNFEPCGSDGDCAAARSCMRLRDAQQLQPCSGAGGDADCFCLSADPVCFSSAACAQGEFCEDDTQLCVAASALVGTELNGESCLHSSNCAPQRSCVHVDADGRSALCAGHRHCFCASAHPSCASAADCHQRESCVSFDGSRICIGDGALPVAPLALSAQPCQRDADCFDASSRVCAAVRESRTLLPCDGGRCACAPLSGCHSSQQCFVGEQCRSDGAGGDGGATCVHDGSLLPPRTPRGFNFEPCALDADCQPFRSCVLATRGANAPCARERAHSCFCVTSSAACSGAASEQCSSGESCFSSDGGFTFACTSDLVIPLL